MVPEIQGVALDDEEQIGAIAAWMAMSPCQVKDAIAYYAEFPEEIDAWVERNERLADEHRAAWRAERGLPSE